MDENTPLRNLNFGFKHNGASVYSNLNMPHLERWLTRLEEVNRKKPFLESRKNIVVVDANPGYLKHVLSQIFPNLLSQAAHGQITTQLPHHNKPSSVEVYKFMNNPLIKTIYARVKGEDSLIENSTRLFAQRKTMGSGGLTEKFLAAKESNQRKIIFPYHVNVEDTNGLTFVAKDEKSLEKLEKKLDAHPFLVPIETEDYLTPKPFGYRALHKTYVWVGNTIPTGILIEVHFETEADHYRNKFGDKNNIRRSHRAYGLSKLRKPHKQGPNQIIILQKNGSIVPQLKPVTLSNEFAKYTLINY